ncbi:ATP-dependent DNA helicase DDX11-like [Mya arenaria]|uniref:ATP-dependent DNA helicase DDX11-like n=1 Tax=Mya arenaria TaxID=6604 RepID=UPI0022E090B8|nr:ATP-dependent DNA helicase DDX11-like [Mya arenaria]
MDPEFDDEGDDLISSFLLPEEKTKIVKNIDENKENWIKSVSLPKEFPFPFEPYEIQKGFMQGLYTCLEQGRVGIFESPTGTGKSLSLICGALRWLKDYQDQQKRELEQLLSGDTSKSDENKENKNGNSADGELDWISEFKTKQETGERSKKIKEEVEQRLKQEAKLTDMRKSRLSAMKRKRAKLEEEFDSLMKGASPEVKQSLNSELAENLSGEGDLDDGDEALIVADYASDEEAKTEGSDDEGDQETVHCTKVYFCSRTHSQLSQFVKEIIKSPYGDNTRVVSLGSRQNLCVNEAVRKLKSVTLINDTCRDLQKKKSDKKPTSDGKKRKVGISKGCPYYRQDPIQDYRDSALLEVRDIEQLVTLGKQMKACPYFGTRLAIPDAEIVALPYNTLLHKSTREASGIKLKDNIVIIDEAHNLLETINSVHSTEVTGAQLVRAHSQLSQYESRYRSRLKAQNLMYIKQILSILQNLTKCLGGKTDQVPDQQMLPFAETRLWTINDFLFHCQLDNVNMFKVLRYCKKSLISRKLYGFVEKYNPEIIPAAEKEKKVESSTSSLSNFLKTISGKGAHPDTGPAPDAVEERRERVVMNSPLMHIEGFLLSLTNADKDGRIVVNKQKLLSQSSIKFLLLNPAVHFADVVREARAVIVAGGTMQPVSEFRDQLFGAAGVPPARVLEYSCGHVIPGEQLLPIAMVTGPTGVQLDFTFQNRSKTTLLDELGRVVHNVCKVVPGGVICFFPSYDYEQFVYTHWENTGVLAKIGIKKKVFREPKKASQVDQVLARYSSCIQNCTGSMTGSLLFCVVGGKMSEGINFADDMGRCVMMVGMPYPNINSPELKEKMEYLNANYPKDSEGRKPGQVHYENLCMKAVNQSIGRAIRHQGDYATILLLDRRYCRAGTVAKLPGWISKHIQKEEKFGPALASISKFFANKR